MIKLKTLFHFHFLFCFLFIAQFNLKAQCTCKSFDEYEPWEPYLLKQLEGEWELFHYTATGMYVAEDKANYYVVRIISDEKPYGAFVYYQKLTLEHNSESAYEKQASTFFHRNYDVKKNFNQRYVASEFFDSEASFLLDKKQKPSYFVKCSKNKDEFGFYSQSENRFYKKVSEYPLGHGNYAFTSMRSVSQKDLKPLKKSDLKEMRNEIFARYHFIFKQDGYWDKHYSQFDWYHEFNENVDSYLTYLEKENAKFILGFEGPEYYDDQFNNDFMDFWMEIQNAKIRNDSVAIFNLIQFPVKVNGESDDIPDISIDKPRMMSVFNAIMEQMYFEIGNNGKPYSKSNSTLFKETNPFKEIMLNTKQNSLGAFRFEKVDGYWKIVGLYADTDSYNKIKNN
jgi:YARHG domain